MSLFVDQMLMQLSQPEQLTALFVPPGDPTQARLRLLLSAAYDMPFTTIHEIGNLQVKTIEAQRPLFLQERTQGDWTQSTPTYSRTDLTLETQNVREPLWYDLLAQLDLTVVAEVDAGEVESILTKSVEDFTTLAEFRNRFRFIDLNAFMDKHAITNVAELKDAYQYLITEIRLRKPPAFDPADPANEHHFTLNVACVIRDTIDVTAALRATKWLQVIAERTLAYRREIDQGEVRTPYAPIVVFPESGLTGSPLTASQLQSFFASERILTLFLQPA